MRLTTRQRTSRLASLIIRASKHMIPYDHVRMKEHLPWSDITIYEILSPLTNTWQEMEVSERMIARRVLPMGVCDLMDYYVITQELVQSARDIQVFNGDLRPISPEEKQIFGVRAGLNNPCFPKRGRRVL